MTNRPRPTAAGPWARGVLALLLAAPGLLAQAPETIVQEAYVKSINTGIQDFMNKVAISGDTLVAGATGEDSAATGVNGDIEDNSAANSGAAYVYTLGPTGWVPQAYLKASNTEVIDSFGESVAISRNTIVIGATGEDSAATGVNGDESDNSASNAGAAYVFVRQGDTWVQQAYLKASNTEEGDFFGESVAISGDTIVVGATREDSAATGVDGDQADNSAGTSGAVYVFVREGTTWSQQAYLKASNAQAGDIFGEVVAISEDTIVVGARLEDSDANGVNSNQLNNTGVDAGAAYVFVREDGVYVFARDGSDWSHYAYLKTENSEPGDTVGYRVAMDGDRVAIASFGESSAAVGVGGDGSDNSAQWAGAVYLFKGRDLWSDLGGGAVGVAGPPTLTGSGTLEAGAPTTVELTSAPAGALVLALYSFESTPLPALGGTLHAWPGAGQLVFVADGTGSAGGAAGWPPGLPTGTEVWFQFVVQDATGVDGLTLSNGLLATTP